MRWLSAFAPIVAAPIPSARSSLAAIVPATISCEKLLSISYSRALFLLASDSSALWLPFSLLTTNHCPAGLSGFFDLFSHFPVPYVVCLEDIIP